MTKAKNLCLRSINKIYREIHLPRRQNRIGGFYDKLTNPCSCLNSISLVALAFLVAAAVIVMVAAVVVVIISIRSVSQLLIMKF